MAKQNEPSKPKLIGLLFTISSGVSLGLLLAVFFLITTPVVQMAKDPGEGFDTPSRYSVPYVKAKVASGESLELKKILRRLENRMAGELVLSEQDVNWLISDLFGTGEGDAAEKRSNAPKFRLKEDGMVFAMPVTVNPNTDGIFKLVLQVNTRFEETEDGFRFAADDLFLNSLRLPAIGLGSMISGKAAEVELPKKLQEGFNLINSIKHQNGSLLLNVGQ